MKYGVPVQKKIYSYGMAGYRPVVPADFNTLETRAQRKMSAEAFAYVAGGAGMERTIAANRDAFSRYKLIASMMKVVSDVDLSIRLWGRDYPTPLLAAPVGALDLIHREADLAVSKACRAIGIPMIYSNQSAFSMEDCSREMGGTPRWFQLYWSKSDELVGSFLHRAEQCGCEAIVVTLDTTSLGWRPRDLNEGYLPFLRGMGLAQYSSDPVFARLVEETGLKNKNEGERPPVNLQALRNVIGLCRRYPGPFFHNLRSGRALAAVKTFIDVYMRPKIRWSDLKRLRDMTGLRILVKGIQTVDDAGQAFDAGVDGIIVSNHGGRQIDAGVGALHCLDKIINSGVASGPVLFDSGIRSGADIIIALALGAEAVLIGRPYVYGLALAGQDGVETVLLHLLAELELQMSLMGVEGVDDLSKNHLSKLIVDNG